MSETIKQPEQQDLHDHLYEQYANISNSDYLQLPKEEQDRLYALWQQRVREAPTLYEWDIRVASVYGLAQLTTMVPFSFVALFGVYSMPDSLGFGTGLIIMAVLLFLYSRYLIDADKLYHYRLTTEGLVTTYHDAIPDVAYAIMRGFAWFGVVVCIMAVAVMGPAALVGAGGFAVGAFFFTGFKNEETTRTSVMNTWKEHVMRVTHNRPFIMCRSGTPLQEDDFGCEMYCHPNDLHKVMSLIINQLAGVEIRLFKNERLLKDSIFSAPESGEPAQLSDFAPRSADS